VVADRGGEQPVTDEHHEGHPKTRRAGMRGNVI
jgi:hypothetical protein